MTASVLIIIIIIIIMEISQAPILQMKALNTHNIAHIMYIDMENFISNNYLTKS